MTTKTAAITLDSPKSRAATTAREDLETLEAKQPSISAAALRGELQAESLADFNDRIDLARLRADATEREAAAELEGLATPKELTTAVDQFLNDDALTTDELVSAADGVRKAIERFHAVNTSRNEAVTGWVKTLRALGISDSGLAIGDDEVRIQSSATGGTTIHIGAARVQAVSNISPYVAHLAHADAKKAEQRLDPANLTRADARSAARAPLVAVRLTRSLGGHSTGDLLTTRTHAASVLARMVHAGDAELIEGTIAAPSKHERTIMPVDYRPLPQEHRSIGNVHDARVVETAVSRAFEA